jgi:hypothetical protein
MLGVVEINSCRERRLENELKYGRKSFPHIEMKKEFHFSAMILISTTRFG